MEKTRTLVSRGTAFSYLYILAKAPFWVCSSAEMNLHLMTLCSYPPGAETSPTQGPLIAHSFQDKSSPFQPSSQSLPCPGYPNLPSQRLAGTLLDPTALGCFREAHCINLLCRLATRSLFLTSSCKSLGFLLRPR